MINLSITAQAVFDKLKKQEVLVKILDSQLKKDEYWDYNLKQLSDPANVRPVPLRSLSSSADRACRYNPKTGSWENVKPSAIRGQSKPHKMHIKKTSMTLAPHDGVMNYCNYYPHWVGILFDSEKCDLKGERYIFQDNAITNGKWWIKGNGGSTVRAVSMVDLRKLNQTHRASGQIKMWNEVLGCPSKESVIGIMIDDKSNLIKNLNAIYRQALVNKYLGKYVPIIVMGSSSTPCEYTEAEIQANLAKIKKKKGKAKYQTAYEFYELIMAVCPDRMAMLFDTVKAENEIRANNASQRSYLDTLFSQGYAFDSAFLKLAIAYKNEYFVEKFIVAKQTKVSDDQWFELLSFWANCPKLIKCEDIQQKIVKLPDFSKHQTFFADMLNNGVNNKSIGLVTFLVGNDLGIAANHVFFKNIMDIFWLNYSKIFDKLLKDYRKDFIASFESRINQTKDMALNKLFIATFVSCVNTKEYVDILLKPQFIFDVGVLKKLVIHPDYHQIFSNHNKRQMLLKTHRSEMNQLLDFFLRKGFIDLNTLFAPDDLFYSDLHRLHQLSQMDLTDHTVIDKIKWYLSKGWNVHAIVKNKTFLEELATQNDGMARVKILINQVPLPENYLLFLRNHPLFVSLQDDIDKALKENDSNNKRLQRRLAFEGKGTVSNDAYVYDNGNYTVLQYMVAKGNLALIENYFKNNDILEQQLKKLTNNTKENLLLLAIKQQRISLFRFLFKKQLNFKMVFKHYQYFKAFIKNNQIAECVEWLNSYESPSKNNTIQSAVITGRIFEDDNPQVVKIFTDVKSYSQQMNKDRLMQLLKSAEKRDAIKCQEALLLSFEHLVNPQELYHDILRNLNLSNAIKSTFAIQAINDFIEKNSSTIADFNSDSGFFARLIIGGAVEGLLSDNIITQNQWLALLTPKVLMCIMLRGQAHWLASLIEDKPKEIEGCFSASEIKKVAIDLPQFFHQLLEVIVKINEDLALSLINGLSDKEKSRYFSWIFLSADSQPENLTYFIKILKASGTTQSWLLTHYADSSIKPPLFNLTVIKAVYHELPDFSLQLFSHWLLNYGYADKAISKIIYSFCFSQDTPTKQWVLSFLRNHPDHLSIADEILPVSLDELLKMAFSDDLNLAGLLLSNHDCKISPQTFDEIKQQYPKEIIKEKIKVLLQLPENHMINPLATQFTDYMPDDCYDILQRCKSHLTLATMHQLLLLSNLDAKITALLQETFLHLYRISDGLKPDYKATYQKLLYINHPNLTGCLTVLATEDKAFSIAISHESLLETLYHLSQQYCPALAIKIIENRAGYLKIATLLQILGQASLSNVQQAKVVTHLARKLIMIGNSYQVDLSDDILLKIYQNNTDNFCAIYGEFYAKIADFIYVLWPDIKDDQIKNKLRAIIIEKYFTQTSFNPQTDPARMNFINQGQSLAKMARTVLEKAGSFAAQADHYIISVALLKDSEALLLLGDSYANHNLNALAIQCFELAIKYGAIAGYYKLIFVDKVNAIKHSINFVLIADKTSTQYQEQIDYLREQLRRELSKFATNWLTTDIKTIFSALKPYQAIPLLEEAGLSILQTWVAALAVSKLNVEIIQHLREWQSGMTKMKTDGALGADNIALFDRIIQTISQIITDTRFSVDKPIAFTEQEEMKRAKLMSQWGNFFAPVEQEQVAKTNLTARAIVDKDHLIKPK